MAADAHGSLRLGCSSTAPHTPSLRNGSGRDSEQEDEEGEDRSSQGSEEKEKG